MAKVIYKPLTKEEMEEDLPSGTVLISWKDWPRTMSRSHDAAKPEAKPGSAETEQAPPEDRSR